MEQLKIWRLFGDERYTLDYQVSQLTGSMIFALDKHMISGYIIQYNNNLKLMECYSWLVPESIELMLNVMLSLLPKLSFNHSKTVKLILMLVIPMYQRSLTLTD